ncbi:MAG: PLDc N-terminal domain-containing protein [Thermodesulfobacteriota bacterium]
MSTPALIIIALSIVSYLLTCWALLDVVGRDFGGIEKKAAWGVVAFIPFAGWVIYLAFGRRRGKPRPAPTRSP